MNWPLCIGDWMNRAKVLVKNYKGTYGNALIVFKRDSIRLAETGYIPISQNWIAGTYSILAFVFAALLCFLLIGILIFFYMIIVSPPGTLTVNYQLAEGFDASIKRKCPACGEMINRSARLCRFCKSTVTPKYLDNVKANDQINKIRLLLDESLDSEQIATHFNENGSFDLNDGSEWTKVKIENIINRFLES